jgi:putative transposase
VTSRGVARAAIARDERDFLALKGQLTEATRKFGWLLFGYCLMPNHYHLILETERELLSAGMHRLNFLYAQRFNRRYDRAGHLFQNRFSSHVIDSDAYLIAAIAYVRDNPVRAGLCERGSDWPWASDAIAIAY